MTASGTMAAPVSSTAEPLGLWGLLKAVRRFLARALMSERDHRLLEIFQKLAESYKAAFNDPEYQELLKSSGQVFSTRFQEPDAATAQVRELVKNSIQYRKDLTN